MTVTPNEIIMLATPIAAAALASAMAWWNYNAVMRRRAARKSLHGSAVLAPDLALFRDTDSNRTYRQVPGSSFKVFLEENAPADKAETSKGHL